MTGRGPRILPCGMPGVTGRGPRRILPCGMPEVTSSGPRILPCGMLEVTVVDQEYSLVVCQG